MNIIFVLLSTLIIFSCSQLNGGYEWYGGYGGYEHEGYTGWRNIGKRYGYENNGNRNIRSNNGNDNIGSNNGNGNIGRNNGNGNIGSNNGNGNIGNAHGLWYGGYGGYGGYDYGGDRDYGHKDNTALWTQGKDVNCWRGCGNKGGLCITVCGPRGYCCRKGFNDCLEEAQKVATSNYHSCVIQSVKVDPAKLAGYWSVFTVKNDSAKLRPDQKAPLPTWSLLRIRKDGEISMDGMKSVLQLSDNQIDFPSSEGWMKASNIFGDNNWSYYRVNEDGNLEIHFFHKYDCEGTYIHTPQACGRYTAYRGKYRATEM